MQTKETAFTDKSPSLTSVDEINSDLRSYPLLEVEQIKDTPLTVVGNKDDGYFIAVGKWRISNKCATIDECKALLEGPSMWEIILNICWAFSAKNNERRDTL